MLSEAATAELKGVNRAVDMIASATPAPAQERVATRAGAFGHSDRCESHRHVWTLIIKTFSPE